MSYELYRQTKIGESLVEALDELVSEDKLPPEMAMKVLEQFDKVRRCEVWPETKAETT